MVSITRYRYYIPVQGTRYIVSTSFVGGYPSAQNASYLFTRALEADLIGFIVAPPSPFLSDRSNLSKLV